MRIDGGIRAGARLSHPGVIVSFQSRHGALQYATVVFTAWQDNVRAIALDLEALRRVERNGIGQARRAVRLVRALTAGPEAPSAERSRDAIRRHGSVAAALTATHPDHGGDPSEFADVQAARDGRA